MTRSRLDHRPPKEDLEELYEQYRRGRTHRELAEELGVHKDTIGRWLREYQQDEITQGD